jgi:hypothetical protein
MLWQNPGKYLSAAVAAASLPVIWREASTERMLCLRDVCREDQCGEIENGEGGGKSGEAEKARDTAASLAA